MTQVSVIGMAADGRLRGSYVYLMLCHDEEGAVLGRIGVSDAPIARLMHLRPTLPFPPKHLAYVRLPNRRTARIVERELRHALLGWRAGDWLHLRDREVFNRTCRRVFLPYESPAWPMTWTQVSVAAVVRAARQRQAAARARLRRDWLARLPRKPQVP